MIARCLICVFVVGTAAEAEDTKNAATRKNAQTQIRELLAQRSLIVTGDVVIDGRYINLLGGQITSQQDIHEHYWFDHSTGSVRVERDAAPLNEILDEPEEEVESEPISERKAFQYVDVYHGERLFHKSVISRKIEIRPRPVKVDWWDVRIFGMASCDDLIHNNNLDAYDKTFDRAFLKGPVPTVSNDDSDGLGVVTLEFRLGDVRDGRRQIWFDSAREFAPVRMSEQFRENDDTWTEPHASSAVTFEHLFDRFLPTSVVIRSFSRGGGLPERESRYELALHWRSCNAPLDDGLFLLESLDVPPKSHTIYDGMDGKAYVVIQHPSIPDLAMLKRIQQQEPQLEQTIPLPRRPNIHLWLILANLGAVMAFLIGVAYRRRKP